MLKDMPVTVIGAGIGGLAAAIALAGRGACVQVLEQAETIREVGAGLQISPNGFAVLRALGIGQAVADRAVQPQAVSLRDYRKGKVLRLDLTRGPHPYQLMHRADLIHILAEAARAAGAEIRLGQSVEQVCPGAPPLVKLSTGETCTSRLVIGADGLHSATRPQVTPTKDAFFTGQVAWRAIVPNTKGIEGDIHLYMGPRRHVVLYPLTQNRLNIVAIQERAAWAAESWTQTAEADDLRAAFHDFGPEVQEVLAQVRQVNLWGLFRHQVAAQWHTAGLAILGDAVHPTLPFMAQGANMALEDAWVLADALDGAAELSERLASYQQRRRARVCRVIEAANGNAWKYHLSFRPMRSAAHSVLRLVGRVAPNRVLGQFDWLYHHDVTQAE